jgi:hypothetical protein
MELKNIIIGLMAFVLFIIVIMGITTDLYSSDNLNVDLSSDNITSPLFTLQQKANESQQDIEDTNNIIKEKVMTNASINNEVSTSDLLASSWSAFTNIPSYIGTFFSLLIETFNSLGMGSTIFVWFFIGSILIVISLIIINSILGSRF